MDVHTEIAAGHAPPFPLAAKSSWRRATGSSGGRRDFCRQAYESRRRSSFWWAGGWRTRKSGGGRW